MGGRRAGLVVSVWMAFTLLMAVSSVVLNVPVVKGNIGSIYIRADGSVEGTDKIISSDNVTYTFTDDIFVPSSIVEFYDGIVVERSNIIIDGNGHTLYGKPGAVGFILFAGGVTIRNTNIRDCSTGIHVLSSSNTISGNNITNNSGGILFFLSDSTLSNNVVTGNNITASGGIACNRLDDSSITGNNITANSGGISLGSFSDRNNISGNYIAANSWHGIWLWWYSTSNTISKNNITANSGSGIYIADYSNYNNISGNNFVGNGLWVSGSSGNVVEDNIVNNKPLVYLDGVSDYTVNDAGQVILLNCDNITVENLNLSSTTVGVELLGTGNSKITNNTISNNNYCGVYLGINWPSPYHSSNNSICANNITNNYYGIQLDYLSSNNSIVRNNITNSGKYGILFYSGNNTASENNIENNDCGIHLGYGGPSNTIFHNNFINNTIQANSYEFNTWDDGYPYGGNYWSDYNSADLFVGLYQNETGSDGIGDTPYIIGTDNQDHYPLMNPWIPGSPIAYFSYAPQFPPVDEIVIFNASTSCDYEGGIVSYEWNFGDGNTTIMADPIITHVYTAEGIYQVNLTVIDNEGLSRSITRSIPIDSTSPTTVHAYDDLWHTIDFEINLTANDDLSGIAETYYQINNGPIKTVSTNGQPLITTEGSNNTLEYWSVDNAGNEESHHILTGIKLDKTVPNIEVPSREPARDVQRLQPVKISVNVTDALSGVKNVTLSYTTNDGATWTNLPMNYNSSTKLYEATIPGQEVGTWVRYKIVAYDNAENPATLDGTEPYCKYPVIPEFPSTLILPLLMTITLLAVILYRKTQRSNCSQHQ